MKVRVLKIGKPADKAYSDLVEKFEKRLKGFLKFEGTMLKAHQGTERSLKELFSKLDMDGGKKDPGHYIICLDERGKIYSSPSLAGMIEEKMHDNQIKQLSFVIGGPYGLPEELRTRADQIWSLSNAVFPSDMAWLMVWEQLYRASTIIRGTGYHHS